LSLGTYHSPNSPITTPVAQLQIHHRSPAGRLARMTSRTISATAHPAVMLPVTSWSFASRGGGGAGGAAFSAGPRNRFTLSGYGRL
jgi:hypothetical protein